MKRLGLVAGLLLVGAFVAFVVSHYDPRRERPEGWRTPWDAQPLLPEGGWSLDTPKRDAMMALFYRATPELAHCSAEYFRGREPVSTPLELLIDVKGGAVQITYALATPQNELSPELLACVERALEGTPPWRDSDLAGKTERWRLGLKFLVHPPMTLRQAHWWDRFVPESWRSGGSSSIHVG